MDNPSSPTADVHSPSQTRRLPELVRINTVRSRARRHLATLNESIHEASLQGAPSSELVAQQSSALKEVEDLDQTEKTLYLKATPAERLEYDSAFPADSHIRQSWLSDILAETLAALTPTFRPRTTSTPSSEPSLPSKRDSGLPTSLIHPSHFRPSEAYQLSKLAKKGSKLTTKTKPTPITQIPVTQESRPPAPLTTQVDVPVPPKTSALPFGQPLFDPSGDSFQRYRAPTTKDEEYDEDDPLGLLTEDASRLETSVFKHTTDQGTVTSPVLTTFQTTQTETHLAPPVVPTSQPSGQVDSADPDHTAYHSADESESDSDSEDDMTPPTTVVAYTPPAFGTIFDGKSNVKDFFRKYEAFAETYGWTDDIKLQQLQFHLKDAAYQCLQYLRETTVDNSSPPKCNLTYTLAKEKLLAYFANKTSTQEYEKQLRERKLKSHEELANYFWDIVRLVKRITKNPTHDFLRDHVLKGLPADMARDLWNAKTKTLEELHDKIIELQKFQSLMGKQSYILQGETISEIVNQLENLGFKVEKPTDSKETVNQAQKSNKKKNKNQNQNQGQYRNSKPNWNRKPNYNPRWKSNPNQKKFNPNSRPPYRGPNRGQWNQQPNRNWNNQGYQNWNRNPQWTPNPQWNHPPGQSSLPRQETNWTQDMQPPIQYGNPVMSPMMPQMQQVMTPHPGNYML